MQRVLSGMSEFYNVYIDHILVFLRSIEEHIDHLRQVFKWMQEFSQAASTQVQPGSFQDFLPRSCCIKRGNFPRP